MAQPYPVSWVVIAELRAVLHKGFLLPPSGRGCVPEKPILPAVRKRKKKKAESSRSRGVEEQIPPLERGVPLLLGVGGAGCQI